MKSSSAKIRAACRDEAGTLKKIGVRGWETTYATFVKPENRRAYLAGEFWSIARLRSVLSDPSAINLVAEPNGVVIGFVTTERLDDGRYEVTRLYVDPDVRSRGIGGRLLRVVLDRLHESGVEEVLVNVFGDNVAGRRFYERHGFKLIEDTFFAIGDQVLSDVWYAVRLDRSSEYTAPGA